MLKPLDIHCTGNCNSILLCETWRNVLLLLEIEVQIAVKHIRLGIIENTLWRRQFTVCILCPMTKYSTFLVVFWQPWPGVSMPTTQFGKQRRCWGRGCLSHSPIESLLSQSVKIYQQKFPWMPAYVSRLPLGWQPINAFYSGTPSYNHTVHVLLLSY